MKINDSLQSPLPKQVQVIIIFCILLFTGLQPATIFANDLPQKQQEYKITGRVTDNKGLPLPGATVLIVGTSTGVATDINGGFTITVYSAAGYLQISSVGYRQQRLSYSAGEFLAVKMEESISELDEVRVIGYGTQSRRQSVGAMSTIKSKDLKDIPSPSVANLMQGKVAGMDVTNMTGAPGGGGISINIRGFNSLSVESGRRGSEPLWVVDGVIMYSFTSPITGLNTLAEIDPKDIESIEVLKDASSASIYGSRAANGVIMVTTRQGKLKQPTQFSANFSQGFSFYRQPKMIGGNLERRIRLEALNNYQEAFLDEETGEWRYPLSVEDIFKYGVSNGYFTGKGNGAYVDILQDSLNPFYNNSTNLFDYYFNTGKTTDANLQMSGGGEKISYNIGLGYYTEKGVLRNTGFNRVKLLSNLYFRPFPRLEGNFRFYVARTGRNRSGKGQDIFNFQAAGDLETIPDVLMTTSTLLPGPGTKAFDELTKRYESVKEKNESYRLRTSFDLTYEFMEGLKLKSSLAIDYSQQNQNIFKPADLDEYNETYSSGQIGRNLMWLNENLLTYKRTFNEAHTIDLLAGLSFQADEENNIQGYGKRAASELIHYVSWYGNVWDVEKNRQLKDFYTDIAKSTSVSTFFRAGYNYRQKYLASVTVRRDASSKFGENTRWGTFPSFGAAYAFSEEPFMAWSRGILDYAKLRVSWGKSGRQFESPYLAFGVLQPGGFNFGGNPTVFPVWYNGLINRDLTWEETKQWDAGFDLDFFNHRLGIVFDYYRRYTDKLLYINELPGNYNGYAFQWQNAYAISNSGIELQIRADLIRNDKLRWDLTINFAHNWNKLEKSNDGRDFINPQYVNNISKVGKPLNGIYAYQDNGLYQSQGDVPFTVDENGIKKYLGYFNQFYRPGDRIIWDRDGNGQIHSNPPLSEDRVYCGSPLPIMQGGIISSLNWKGFDLNVLFSYSLGRHILNAGSTSIGTRIAMNPEEIASPIFAGVGDLNFWQKPGDRGCYPANRTESGLQNFTPYLSSHVEKVNYIKLKTLTIGYTLPENVRKAVGFSTRIFLSAENLFTITNYSGNDPESVDIVTGIDNYNNYPLSRKLTLGLTLNF